MVNPVLVLCASCIEPLWIVRQVGAHVAHFPYRPEIPPYSPKMKTCPLCDQPLALDTLGNRKLLKDEESGRLRVA